MAPSFFSTVETFFSHSYPPKTLFRASPVHVTLWSSFIVLMSCYKNTKISVVSYSSYCQACSKCSPRFHL